MFACAIVHASEVELNSFAGYFDFIFFFNLLLKLCTKMTTLPCNCVGPSSVIYLIWSLTSFLSVRPCGHWEMLLEIRLDAVILFSVMELCFLCWRNWMSMLNFLCLEMPHGHSQTSAGESHNLLLIRYKVMHNISKIRFITYSQRVITRLYIHKYKVHLCIVHKWAYMHDT